MMLYGVPGMHCNAEIHVSYEEVVMLWSLWK